ncbi:glycosyltransferase family 1 protein [Sphingomonas sp. SUN039]|uniref:glycosyltransferase family 4 protein n=1 Tax=Sphingomonas sp. SUN039 TaxID=2937787 RepID=UPI00216441B1|nr:glycosyltransferase family 1 protein [Sphingomonas sp. SUN039]UVO54240.1 glycosyltransferase family 1 protein [Sphingomonas sp. SUN039]
MQISDLRIALTSGNYNYVRDGANRALNNLVGWLLDRGAAVRVYAPVVAEPAFAPTGDLVAVRSVPLPFRPEYQVPLGLGAAKRDIDAFKPNIMHLSSPELLGHSTLRYAKSRKLPVLASVHTRFETYFRYYGIGFLEPLGVAIQRRFYQQCDAIVAPSDSMADVLREERMNADVGIWSRGIDRDVFNPARRSLDWRRSLGIADDDFVIAFFGRIVLEKGIDVFGDVIVELKRRGIAHKVLVIGDGPARDTFAAQVPEAIFAGHQAGTDLGRAIASADLLLQPSVTETFGNVTSEAMACALPVVGADATGTRSLVTHGVTGALIAPRDIAGYADAIAHYADDCTAAHAAGKAGERVADGYTWDAVNGTLAAKYIDIIARRRAAGKG